MKPLKIALIGVGGFGRVHVSSVLEMVSDGLVELVAFAEPRRELPTTQQLLDAGARGYIDHIELFEQEKSLDVVTVATPIHTHFPITMSAFERGIHVFLEKPPVVRIQDFRLLEERALKCGCSCIVGFHDIARSEIQALKKAILENSIGKLRSIRGYALWRRTDKYYARTSWAGKLMVNGHYVLDGPMNNSCAHLLNLACFLSGATVDGFAKPTAVQGELYRAAPIESEDTDCVRSLMDSGVYVCLHLTQAARRSFPRVLVVTGELGQATFSDEKGVTFSDGRFFPASTCNLSGVLMRSFITNLLASQPSTTMTLSNSEGFVLMSNGAYESSQKVHTIPQKFVERIEKDDGSGWHITGIEEVMKTAALGGLLISETGVSWGCSGEEFYLADYRHFPTRWRAK